MLENYSRYWLLLRFEVTPGNGTVVTNVPEAAYFSGVGTGCNVDVRDADTIDCDAGRIPRIDVVTQIVGLPAEHARAILRERSRDRGRYRATSCAARLGGGNSRRDWSEGTGG